MPASKINRASTGDRGPPGDVDIITVEQLSPKMSKLPNGSLLCRDVAIARIGWMMYGPGETPIKVGDSGIAYVERTAEDLFSPECIGSFVGAALVDEHPTSDVTPQNWKSLAKGFATTNVRRGEGDDYDCLMADLIVTDAGLIESVLAGKREVSCGYEADYKQTGDGQGKQSNIIGNHIALVEKGRCGPRCAIGDRALNLEGNNMPGSVKRMVVKTKRRAVLDAARQKVKDAMEELDQVSAEDPEEGEADEGATTHIHIHQGGASKGSTTSEDDGEEGDPGQEEDPTEARFKAIETGMAALADSVKGLTEAMRPAAAATDEEDDGDGGDDDTDTQDGDEPFDEKNGMAKDGEAEPSEDDKKKGTTDSAALATSYALTLASAEILVPGFRMPTFDGKAKRKKTIDAMCGARRKCLDIVYATKDGQTLVDSVAGKSGIDLAKMSCGSIATLFKAASGVKALLNNRSATGDSGGMAKVDEPKPAVTIADINKANQSYWAGRVAKA